MKKMLGVFLLVLGLMVSGRMVIAGNFFVIPAGKKATGDATAADVLRGKTFSNSNATGLTGSRPPAPVEKTGQKASYMTGDDGSYEKGVSWPVPRFSAGTYLVTDNLTGLKWQKSANNGTMNWYSAIDYCNNLTVFEPVDPYTIRYDDWRLPNIRELHSLIDFGHVHPALSDATGTLHWSEGDAFSDVQTLDYWSSTTTAYSTVVARCVNFNGGDLNNFGKGVYNHVWCVHGGY